MESNPSLTGFKMDEKATSSTSKPSTSKSCTDIKKTYQQFLNPQISCEEKISQLKPLKPDGSEVNFSWFDSFVAKKELNDCCLLQSYCEKHRIPLGKHNVKWAQSTVAKSSEEMEKLDTQKGEFRVKEMIDHHIYRVLSKSKTKNTYYFLVSWYDSVHDVASLKESYLDKALIQANIQLNAFGLPEIKLMKTDSVNARQKKLEAALSALYKREHPNETLPNVSNVAKANKYGLGKTGPLTDIEKLCQKLYSILHVSTPGEAIAKLDELNLASPNVQVNMIPLEYKSDDRNPIGNSEWLAFRKQVSLSVAYDPNELFYKHEQPAFHSLTRLLSGKEPMGHFNAPIAWDEMKFAYDYRFKEITQIKQNSFVSYKYKSDYPDLCKKGPHAVLKIVETNVDNAFLVHCLKGDKLAYHMSTNTLILEQVQDSDNCVKLTVFTSPLTKQSVRFYLERDDYTEVALSGLTSDYKKDENGFSTIPIENRLSILPSHCCQKGTIEAEQTAVYWHAKFGLMHYVPVPDTHFNLNLNQTN